MALLSGTQLQSQYQDSSNLAARGRLHARYGTVNWFTWVADRLGLESGMRVLDIGCGAGWLWNRAASRLPNDLKLMLVDRSAGMVAEAYGRTSSHGRFEAVDALIADATALPFADSSFDTVVAMHMLYHVPDPMDAVREMARVLRPDGRAIVTTNGRRNLGAMFELGARAFGGPSADPAAAVFGVDAAKAMMGGCFERVDLARFKDVYVISDPNDVFAYITSMPPGIDAGMESRNALRQLIEQAFEANAGTLKVEREGGMLIARTDSP